MRKLSRSHAIGLSLAAMLLAGLLHFWAGGASAQSLPESLAALLPPPQVHPLPETLAQWQDPDHLGDYFADIQPTNLGYLVWSDLPIAVYVEPAGESDLPIDRAARLWVEAVQQSVAEWNTYLPLGLTDSIESADIKILRRTPPLLLNPLRARTAETRYEFYVDRSVEPATLAHRYQILLRPDQPIAYTLATARHELGHALGIWGHSPAETDALYFSQVREPAPISARDVNTLKRIYQQPTRVGWEVPDHSSSQTGA